MSARLAVVLGLVLAAPACRVPNEDHCLHRATDSNEWCAENETDRGFCSPCVAEHHGCVKTEPTPKECPEYGASPPADSSSGTEASGTDATGSEASSTDGSSTGGSGGR